MSDTLFTNKIKTTQNERAADAAEQTAITKTKLNAKQPLMKQGNEKACSNNNNNNKENLTPERRLDDVKQPTTAKAPPKNLFKDANLFRQQSAAAAAAVAAPTKKGANKTPQAYRFKDIYQKKKEQLLQQRAEDERKLREFHSRPMPDFQSYHKQLERRNALHRVTCPTTPQTLRTSRAREEKRKQQLAAAAAAEERRVAAELEQQKQAKAKLRQKTTSYLKQPAFVPIRRSRSELELKPFNLRSEKRVQARKEFDHQIRAMQQQNREQQQRVRAQHEIAELEQQRLKTKFKARPNPFQMQKFASLENVSFDNPFRGLLEGLNVKFFTDC